MLWLQYTSVKSNDIPFDYLEPCLRKNEAYDKPNHQLNFAFLMLLPLPLPSCWLSATTPSTKNNKQEAADDVPAVLVGGLLWNSLPKEFGLICGAHTVSQS